ncbi:MAG: hypothetical protein GW859_06020 [Sphingomonadales bacterium]|nr:hypothetical protein [Sphingomonadales bacterium]
MESTLATLAAASIAFAGIAMIAMVGLSAWREWIGLKREQIAHAGSFARLDADDDAEEAFMLSRTGSRIEVADLKERIRKLEAIASGVDL